MTTTPSLNFRRRLAVVVACPLALLALLPAAARAQDAGDQGDDSATVSNVGSSFAVQPSGPDGPGQRDWFSYTLDPGEVFGDVVAISNLSGAPIQFEILASDAESVADSAGFAALKNPTESVDVGTWIEFAPGDYVVQPGSRIDVPFSVTVPEDAEPGDHAGAILAADASAGAFDPTTAPDGVSFDIRYRLGARIYVRVGGETAPALRIDGLHVERDGGQAIVSWDVLNTGNLRLEPEAQIRITGWFGRTVGTSPVQQLPELLPNANYTGATVLDGMPPYEPLTAHLEVTAPDVAVERSLRFAPYPWLLIGVVALLLGGSGWWLWRRRRRRSRGPVAPTPPDRRTDDRVPVPA